MVQFVNILDFMMVMPLGPDFSRELGIPTHQMGWVGGAYTASAFLSGVVGSFFLDRLDRRLALVGALIGLAVATIAGGFATDLPSLLAARMLAGWFGGPATSVALAIVSDQVPSSRRGRAMGLVMLAFSVASILGVPAGLELARIGSWRTPFYGVGALCLLLTGAAFLLLPPLKHHLAHAQHKGVQALTQIFKSPLAWTAFASIAASMMTGFLLIPNLSPYLQLNLHFPRERLGLLYFIGGVCTLLVGRTLGAWVDRVGSTRVMSATTLVFGLVVYFFVIHERTGELGSGWIAFFFASFMVSMSSRNIALQSLASQVPKPEVRAQFMSLQNSVQHLASAAGAGLSSLILATGADGRLGGMRQLGILSILISWTLPFLIGTMERQVRAREINSLPRRERR